MTDTSERVLRNLRFKVAYDGSAYHGWQIQENGPTIQGALEEAVLKMTGERSVVESSGRTDTGVHAVGQVGHFLTYSRIPVYKFRRGLQSYLPFDIVIMDVEEAPLKFHSRFQAKRKRYRYVVDNHPVSLPFFRNYAWFHHTPLDVEAMHTSVQALIGTHDFRSFETKGPNKESSVRTMFEASVTRLAAWPAWGQPGGLHLPVSTAEGCFVCFDIVGNGFLYNMVRSIMGTLLEIGRGNRNSDEIARALQAQDRREAGMTAPAHGLYLMSVDYQ
ncbi:MAG: tRNA pseudouridine(38-40) synthase TruA [Planctomycetales bacterium]